MGKATRYYGNMPEEINTTDDEHSGGDEHARDYEHTRGDEQARGDEHARCDEHTGGDGHARCDEYPRWSEGLRHETVMLRDDESR